MATTITKTTLRLSTTLLERARIRAIQEHTTLQELITEALTERLKRPIQRPSDSDVDKS